jgi:transcriptional regulator with XRE-family HTH domain
MTQTAMNAEVASISPIAVAEHVLSPNMRLHTDALIAYFQRLVQAGEDIDIAKSYLQTLHDISHFVDLKSCLVSDLTGRREPRLSRETLLQFGKLLKDRRLQARLSRAALGKKTGLSEATIKFIETARTRPTRGTLLRLMAVEELQLTWADLAILRELPLPIERSTTPQEHNRAGSMNWYVTPGYDGVRLVEDLARFLQGAGGLVEQTSAYLDHHSALDYLAMTRGSSVTMAHHSKIPLHEIAKAIIATNAGVGLNVIVLGAGNGVLETKLVQDLIAMQSKVDADLCLLDISQPLLSVAYKHAVDTLGGIAGMHIWAMQGNFHRLGSYTQLHYQPSSRTQRTRVYTILGCTLANLDDEVQFLMNNLNAVARTNDYLVVDLQLGWGRTPDEIMANDPALQGEIPKATARWLEGPIRRSCPDVREIHMNCRLDPAPMPGSYTLTVLANVRSQSQGDRMFSMFRFRRHDKHLFVRTMDELGWDLVAGPPMAREDGREISAVLLFRRR